MDTIALVLRVALATVFAVAAVSKARTPTETRRAAREFGLSDSLAGVAVVALPLVELIVAASLLAQSSVRIGALLAVVLLAIFTAAIIRLMMRGEQVACNCFGQLQSTLVGRETVVRNLMLAVVAGAVFVTGPGLSPASLSLEDLALLATTIASVGLCLSTVRLRSENRVLRARAASGDDVDRGLPRGSSVPALELKTLEGTRVAVTDLVGGGRPALLVQIGIGCSPCHLLLPELARWGTALVDSVDILVVSSGDLESNRLFAAGFGLTTMLVDEEWGFPAAFDVRPTPSAVLIDARGRIAGPPALGTPAIEGLVRSVLGAEAQFVASLR